MLECDLGGTADAEVLEAVILNQEPYLGYPTTLLQEHERDARPVNVAER